MLKKEKIVKFVNNLAKNRDLKFYTSEYLRTSSIYRSLTIFNLLREDLHPHKPFALCYLKEVRNRDGGYGASIGFPSSVVATFSALQAYDLLSETVYDEKTEDYLLSQINEDGSPCEEDDLRILCCIILSLLLLNRAKENIKSRNREIMEKVKFNFDEEIKVNLEKEAKKRERTFFSDEFLCHLIQKGFRVENVIKYTLDCFNFDGGFGANATGESHSAYIFCSISILRSFNHLDSFDFEKTAQFLSFRQNESGGLSGRPNKKEDVCYSFWTFSSLVMLKKEDYICKESFVKFIYSCHKEGFSDEPGNEEDLFHTLFALAGLSLLKEGDLNSIDPALCI